MVVTRLEPAGRERPDDPRGRGFRQRTSLRDVRALIEARVQTLQPEVVPLRGAGGRVLAAGVVASAAVPPFDRAAMDGYALRGEETFGSSSYSPSWFRVIGRSRPGARFCGQVGAAEAVEVTTGAPMPAGADTVVPYEQASGNDATLRVVAAFPPGRHVSRKGEDVAPGTVILEAGRRLRPQDLGLLSGVGIAAVSVIRRPRVAILVTGGELLPPGSPAVEDRIPDMNSVMLEALVIRDGGLPAVIGPVPDDPAVIGGALRSAIEASDAVLVSGGSSTGPEDHAPALVSELGELPVHGLALRPASPAGLGFVGHVPVVLLPGNPVSCLCAYDLIAGPIIRRLGGKPETWPYTSVERPLVVKLSSGLGRLDYVRVRLVGDGVEPIATGGASILSSVTTADGFLLVPEDLEGYPAGTRVQVWLYDSSPLLIAAQGGPNWF